jgi:hypothetical protein
MTLVHMIVDTAVTVVLATMTVTGTAIMMAMHVTTKGVVAGTMTEDMMIEEGMMIDDTEQGCLQKSDLMASFFWTLNGGVGSCWVLLERC